MGGGAKGIIPGNGGHTVPLDKELSRALIELKTTRNAPEPGEHVILIHSERPREAHAQFVGLPMIGIYRFPRGLRHADAGVLFPGH